MIDEYKKHNCEFKNKSDCEEELDEEGKNLGEVEETHFEEKEN